MVAERQPTYPTEISKDCGRAREQERTQIQAWNATIISMCGENQNICIRSIAEHLERVR
jgi:hypothetical protein